MEIINLSMFENSGRIAGASPCELLEMGVNGCGSDILAPHHVLGDGGSGSKPCPILNFSTCGVKAPGL